MIKYWCDNCGNDNLEFDAVLSWNYTKQEFEIECVGDRVWCGECVQDGYYSQGSADQQARERERLTQ